MPCRSSQGSQAALICTTPQGNQGDGGTGKGDGSESEDLETGMEVEAKVGSMGKSGGSESEDLEGDMEVEVRGGVKEGVQSRVGEDGAEDAERQEAEEADAERAGRGTVEKGSPMESEVEEVGAEADESKKGKPVDSVLHCEEEGVREETEVGVEAGGLPTREADVRQGSDRAGEVCEGDPEG
eukprot:scaffold63914_cov16-Tisochrysis_lutea.AAC.3